MNKNKILFLKEHYKSFSEEQILNKEIIKKKERLVSKLQFEIIDNPSLNKSLQTNLKVLKVLKRQEKKDKAFLTFILEKINLLKDKAMTRSIDQEYFNEMNEEYEALLKNIFEEKESTCLEVDPVEVSNSTIAITKNGEIKYHGNRLG